MPTYTASEPAKLLDFVEPGDYPVEIIDATETISQSGNDMIELKLRTQPGSIVYDHLVFTPSAFWKIDQFRVAIGESVESGEVEVNGEDLIGRAATVRIVVEEYNGRKRNKVGAWLAPAPAQAQQPASRATAPAPIPHPRPNPNPSQQADRDGTGNPF
jgi:hypothetical protein